MYKNRIILLFIPVFFCFHCIGTDYSTLEDIHKKENFPAFTHPEIQSRITTAPDFVLKYLQELDQNPHYRNHILDPTEKHEAVTALKFFPDFMTNTMRDRLLGIYFIDNFQGSGLTEWAVDRDGRVFCFMAFNPSVLGKNMTELLTWKENTVFINENNDGKKISVNCGNRENAFLYILLHESFHLYDYVYRITPYLEDSIKDYFRLSEISTEYTGTIWCGIRTPCKKLQHTGKISFYGLGRKTELHPSKAIEIYDELSRSPFISLYSTLSWSEDFAEMGAFYHLTEKLHYRYYLYVLNDGKIEKEYQPATFPSVKDRFSIIKKLYIKKQ